MDSIEFERDRGRNPNKGHRSIKRWRSRNVIQGQGLDEVLARLDCTLRPVWLSDFSGTIPIWFDRIPTQAEPTCSDFQANHLPSGHGIPRPSGERS